MMHINGYLIASLRETDEVTINGSHILLNNSPFVYPPKYYEHLSSSPVEWYGPKHKKVIEARDALEKALTELFE